MGVGDLFCSLQAADVSTLQAAALRGQEGEKALYSPLVVPLLRVPSLAQYRTHCKRTLGT